MGNMKKAPVGRSSKTDMGKKNPDAAKSGNLHKGGKTVATWDSTRNDKLEGTNPKTSGGVKK